MDALRGTLLVLVERPWWTDSAWDSYTKRFETEKELLDWWLAFPDESFTKRHALVSVFRVERIDDILAPSALPRSLSEEGGQ